MAQEIFASLTSSTSTRTDHDLFVSFNGEDTRSGFIGYLFEDLKRKGILTYGDNKERPRGEPIWTDQVKAINKSKIAVIVFSKNYASSECCLNELVEIMKFRRSLQKVLPVFYDVRPCEVREQKGSFAEALSKQEERFGEDKVKMWRAALTDAANLSGWDSRNYRFEFKFIEEIVEEISQKLELPLDDSSRDARSTRILTRISTCIPNSRLIKSRPSQMED